MSVTTKRLDTGEDTTIIASQGTRERAKSPAWSHCAPNTTGNSHGARAYSAPKGTAAPRTARLMVAATREPIRPGSVRDSVRRNTWPMDPTIRATGTCSTAQASWNCPSEATAADPISRLMPVLRTASTRTLGPPSSAILRYLRAISAMVGAPGPPGARASRPRPHT